MATAIQQENFGQAAFTKSGLAVYDWLVLKAICPWIWGCSNKDVLAFYRKHLSGNHLEVGVGTGYFLDHCIFPVERPKVTLLDLNANCLERTKKRIARYHPKTYQANILQPIAIGVDRFDSIGLNYVLHCLPGTFPAKEAALVHLKALLNPGGVIFGSTVLNGGVKTNAFSRAVLRFFNARQTLCNEQDTYAGLLRALEKHFSNVHVTVTGRVALFSGKV
jgi:SAM-dependent methyltransferase